MKKELEKDVFPGEKLAVIEEYNDGPGTYREEGEIRSAEMGKTRINSERRELVVKKTTPEILVPEKGMDVIANVGSVARRDARIDIFALYGKHIHPTYSGVVHISDISRDYIKNIDMALKNGDIIKGKLVNVVNRLNQTSLEGSEYGVIYAYCSRCGGLLELKQGKLICPDCGRVERRKTAKSYGKEELV
ncbi:exosome complex RNA-binding protein Csl4 [Thermoproteota archaeon]